jgi:hypothetical protein
VDRARVLFDDDEPPRDEEEREPAVDEEREPAVDESRELELFREFDALRPLDAAFVLLPLPPAPFLDALLEPPDVLRRVLAFACAIRSSSRSSPLRCPVSVPGFVGLPAQTNRKLPDQELLPGRGAAQPARTLIGF